ncbi:MAG: OPT/YSL family transporter [Thermoplasmata archaeon]|nr:MAG: OPT/YSL family transporter [Thermoplasmata archaeon]
MAVKKSVYREAPTAAGLEKIEKGTLDYMDKEVWSNLNTGVLEEYFEEKNRKESFSRSRFIWKKVAVGIILGTIFAVITTYVGLKVGIAISGGWYIMYLIGAALKWHPCDINVAGGASTGATYIGTGFIFTFPAIYLLTTEDYILADGTNIIESVPGSVLVVALIATIFTGILGTLYFIILRRVWLVEDPLHMPGWEPNLQLMDISNDIVKGEMVSARRSLRLFTQWTGLTMLFTFFRDFPVGRMDESFAYYNAYSTPAMPNPQASSMDILFKGGAWYEKGNIIQPYEDATYTHIGFGLIPIQIGLGWFMKLKVSILVNLGTFITWFIIVPMAVLIGVPIFDASQNIYREPMFYTGLGSYGFSPAIAAFAKVARPIAVGTILGAGITGLLKMIPTFKSAMSDVLTVRKGGKRRDFIEGRGWYEWPVTHIWPMTIITFIVVFFLFWFGFEGSNPLVSLIFSLVLVSTTFALGAIAVKVMGETGTQPVSGTSFIVLIMLILVFMGLGLSKETTAIIVLIGTTVFAGAISMEGDIIWDFKSGLYVGNRPYHLMKGELTGIIPGAIASVLAAVMFSELLASGELPLVAPQANAFATIVQTFLGGSSMGMLVSFLLIGFALGVLLEIVTGMGTAIGLGMYFPLWLTTPMIFGGAMRDIWEKKWLEPKVKKEKWTEKQKTIKVLDTYMIATGLIVGEAIMGTIVAIYFIFS